MYVNKKNIILCSLWVTLLVSHLPLWAQQPSGDSVFISCQVNLKKQELRLYWKTDLPAGKELGTNGWEFLGYSGRYHCSPVVFMEWL